jgi:hypothetical protein
VHGLTTVAMGVTRSSLAWRASMADIAAAADRFDFDSLQHAVARVRSEQVFFIGGAPKSGTTWLQYLLNAHPEVSCGGEGHFPNRLLPMLAKALQTYNTGINVKNRSIYGRRTGQPLFTDQHAYHLVTVAIGMMLSRPEKPNARIVGDKTPDNVRHFALLANLFPRAKFIHIVRDARDCAVSAWFHNQRLNPTELAKKFDAFGPFAERFAQIWAGNVRTGVTFANAAPERCLTIRYEDLCDNSLNSLDPVCAFLGASRDPATLRACCEAADFVNLSGGRSRGQEDRGSFFRRGVPGDWRRHFDVQTERAFREKAEPWMANFRYSLEGADAVQG